MRPFPFQSSFWFQAQSPEASSLRSNQNFDIVIAGGGFAGLSSALHLKAVMPALRIAVLESKHVGFGASGRSGGWLVPFPPLYWLADDLRDPKKREQFSFATRFTQENLHALMQSLPSASLPGNWLETQHLLIARNRLEDATIRWLKARLESFQFHCDYKDYQTQASTIGYPGLAAIAWDTALINPYWLVRCLAGKCRDLGVEILEYTPLQKVRPSKAGLALDAGAGFQIQADKLILATNAYSGLIDLDLKIPRSSVQHTYMLATQILSPPLIDRISRDQRPFGDATLQYFCGRFFDQRLLFNGGDRASQPTEANDQHLRSFIKLHREMIRRFPELESARIESAWGGAVLQTASDAPVIQPARNNPNIIFNLGYGGGSGISMALQSGRLVADLILGDRSHDAEARRMRTLIAETRFPMLGPLRAVTGVLKKLITRSGAAP